MATLYDINPNILIEKAADELKKIIKAPEFSKYSKSGAGRERPPIDKDWYYKRAAAVLRSVYLQGPIGTNKLRTKYGNKRNMGVTGERVFKASGKIIRLILQQVEKAGLIKQVENGVDKGRIITSKGKKFLDNLSK